MRQRFCFFVSDLSFPIDEGVKKFAVSLIKYMSRHAAVSAFHLKRLPSLPEVKSVQSNVLLLGSQLAAAMHQIKPDTLFYIPNASINIGSLYRGWILKRYTPRTKIVMIALQPAFGERLHNLALNLWSPDLIFVQSARMLDGLAGKGCPVKLLPSGVDLEQFKPATAETRRALRAKYGLSTEDYVILHIGHISRSRNLSVLADVQSKPGIQVVLVGSSSTQQDTNMRRFLEQSGVRVISDYIPAIETIYQLADGYIFPVEAENGAIQFPLSVLESLACNIPVLSTRFGGLPTFFPEGKGILYADQASLLGNRVDELRSLKGVTFRSCVESFSWERVVQQLLNEMSEGG